MGPAPGEPTATTRRGKGPWIALAALLLVIAVAAALVFGVFKDQVFGGAGPATTPEKTVERLLSALEDRDLDAIMGLLSSDWTARVLEVRGYDEIKDELSETSFDYESMDFSDIRMVRERESLRHFGDLTITVTEGTWSGTYKDGTEWSYDLAEGEGLPIEVIEEDGKWYVAHTILF